MNETTLGAIFLVLLINAECFGVQSYFINKYGLSYGDRVLPIEDDTCYRVGLRFDFMFFNQRQRYLTICINGSVQFDSPKSRIEVYSTDFITINSGNIYFRRVRDFNTLDPITMQARRHERHIYNHTIFNATNAFKVTWENVPLFDDEEYKLHTFQLILATMKLDHM